MIIAMKVAQNTKARETCGATSGLRISKIQTAKTTAVGSSPDKGKERREEKPED